MQVEDEGRLVAAQADDAVTVEILHALRLAEALEISMRGIGMVLDREQAALDQIGLSRTPQPDRDVGLAHGKVELVVGQDQLDVDLRVEVEKLRDAVGQPDAADPDGGRDLEIAGGPLARLREALARLLQATADVLRRPEQHVTMLGQDETAGMTMEERNVQVPLEGADLRLSEDWFRSSFSPARVKFPASATS